MGIKKFARYVVPANVYLSLSVLYREIRVYLRHRRGVARSKGLARQTGLKLHLGCGNILKDGWVNVDAQPPADLTLDLREPLPLSDDSCSIVYSEHFLEHLEYPEPTRSLLRECHRILEPDGRFSVGVPDTEWPIMEYAELRSEGYFGFAKERWHPDWCETEMEHLNYHFRQRTEHKFAYDFKTLESVLRMSGFTSIHAREFDPELDSPDRRLGTLYVDATKTRRPG